jgi:hypothetical protein
MVNTMVLNNSGRRIYSPAIQFYQKICILRLKDAEKMYKDVSPSAQFKVMHHINQKHGEKIETKG